MKEFVSKQTILTKLAEIQDQNQCITADVVEQILNDLPPEIVHCYECRHGTHSGCADRYLCFVNWELRVEHSWDFYCGYGKRREV